MLRWRRCSWGSGGDQVGHDGVGVSCVGDGAMQWQIHLHAASDVVVGKQGWPSCTRQEEMAVML